MKNRWIVPLVVLVALCAVHQPASAQSSKETIHNLDGQITKIDKKNKTVTIKGPKEGINTESVPQGRGTAGGVVGGRGGRGRAPSSGGGGIVSRMADVESKIVLTDKTEYISETEGGKLEFSDLRLGDYIKVTATGKNLECTSLRRVTAANGSS